MCIHELRVCIELLGKLLDVVAMVLVLTGEFSVSSLGRSLVGAVATQGAEVELSRSWLSHLAGCLRKTPCRYAKEELTRLREASCFIWPAESSIDRCLPFPWAIVSVATISMAQYL